MISQLFDGALLPFTTALGLLLGLLGLELVMLLIGGSLLGSGDAPDVEVGFDADADFAIDADGDFDLEAGADASADALDEVEAGIDGGLAAWLGLGNVPALIWLAVFLALFGLAGVSVQMLAQTVTGVYAAPWLAALPAGGVALFGARGFSGVFARLLPKSESQAISERSMGRRKGVITQGTAARGRPAEVKITDGYGNSHYLRAEPLDDNETLAAGTEVLVLRHRPSGQYRLVALSA
ncbi:OB-fold-containig protein [Roseobacteraceae bacterium S113]